MSKVLNRLMQNNPDKINEWYKDQDGYWIVLKEGWLSSLETSCIHEDTVTECVKEFRYIEKG